MSKHTPGPWALNLGKLEGLWHKSGNGWRMLCWVEEDKNGDLTETIGFRSGEADMRLIAAAPDLLEALERSLSWLSSYPGNGALAAYDQARTAIAKAEGR